MTRQRFKRVAQVVSKLPAAPMPTLSPPQTTQYPQNNIQPTMENLKQQERNLLIQLDDARKRKQQAIEDFERQEQQLVQQISSIRGQMRR